MSRSETFFIENDLFTALILHSSSETAALWPWRCSIRHSRQYRSTSQRSVSSPSWLTVSSHSADDLDPVLCHFSIYEGKYVYVLTGFAALNLNNLCSKENLSENSILFILLSNSIKLLLCSLCLIVNVFKIICTQKLTVFQLLTVHLSMPNLCFICVFLSIQILALFTSAFTEPRTWWHRIKAEPRTPTQYYSVTGGGYDDLTIICILMCNFLFHYCLQDISNMTLARKCQTLGSYKNLYGSWILSDLLYGIRYIFENFWIEKKMSC